MKHLFLALSVILFSSFSLAGKFSAGPDEETGGRIILIEGCTTLTNVTGNIEGFSVVPEMSRENWSIICDFNTYKGVNNLQIFTEIAKKAKDKGCFDSKIDETAGTIHIEYLENDVVVTHTKERVDTYEASGFESLEVPDKEVRTRHLCVLDEKGLEYPYDALLKNPTN